VVVVVVVVVDVVVEAEVVELAVEMDGLVVPVDNISLDIAVNVGGMIVSIFEIDEVVLVVDVVVSSNSGVEVVVEKSTFKVKF